MNNRQAAIQSAIELLREEGYEVKEPPKPERIEVVFTWINLGSGENKTDAPFSHFFKTDKAIPEDKRPALIRAIEEVLNDEQDLQILEKEFPKQKLEQLTEQYRSMSDHLRKCKYTEKELLEAEEKAFNAGREKDTYPSMVDGSEVYKYWRFSNYKSHNQQSK